MSRAYTNFQHWRQRTKRRLIEAFGGACGICGYSRCQSSLVFHHLDPNEKDFSITGKRVAGWRGIAVEARKCVMLCANCHGEVHAGVTAVPDTCRRFDEHFAAYDGLDVHRRRPRRTCLRCGSVVSQKAEQPYCSRSCAAKSQRKNFRVPPMTREETVALLASYGNRWQPAARSIGITDNALRKRAAALGLATKGYGHGPSKRLVLPG